VVNAPVNGVRIDVSGIGFEGFSVFSEVGVGISGVRINELSTLASVQNNLVALVDTVAPLSAVTSLVLSADVPGQVKVKLNFNTETIQTGDLLRVYVGTKLLYEGSFTNAAYLSVALHKDWNKLTGKSISVYVLDRAGNETVHPTPLTFDINAVTGVTSAWLQELVYFGCVNKLNTLFLNNLSDTLIAGLTAEFVNAISHFGTLGVRFLNNLSTSTISEIHDTQLAQLSSATLGMLNTNWATTVPQITGCLVKSVAGHAIHFVLTMSQYVTLMEGSNVPRLKLSNHALAYYVSGSGTDTLVFEYIPNGGESISGLTLSTLELNGAKFVGHNGAAANFMPNNLLPTVSTVGTLQINGAGQSGVAAISPVVFYSVQDNIGVNEGINGAHFKVSLLGTGARVGDVLELLLHGESLKFPLKVTLSEQDITNGHFIFEMADFNFPIDGRRNGCIGRSSVYVV
jgi:hypothetical protein